MSLAAAIPTPGGAPVGLPKFALMAVGAAGGIALYSQVLTQYIPDSWENWSIGPISGTTLWFGASALLGAALAAKIGGHK